MRRRIAFVLGGLGLVTATTAAAVTPAVTPAPPAVQPVCPTGTPGDTPPALIGQTLLCARSMLADWSPTAIVVTDPADTGRVPPDDLSVTDETTSPPETIDGNGRWWVRLAVEVIVPTVTGLSYPHATKVLDADALVAEPTLAGADTTVSAQDPAPGALLPFGGTVVLTLATPTTPTDSSPGTTSATHKPTSASAGGGTTGGGTGGPSPTVNPGASTAPGAGGGPGSGAAWPPYLIAAAVVTVLAVVARAAWRRWHRHRFGRRIAVGCRTAPSYAVTEPAGVPHPTVTVRLRHGGPPRYTVWPSNEEADPR